MKTDEVLKKLAPWVQKHKRWAWKPVVEDGDGPPSAAKFCGTPWIDESSAPWPFCKNCKLPLHHFLQLNLDALPTELNNQFGDGLLQLFYCTREECQGMGGWEPFDGINHARVIHPAPNAVPLVGVPEQEEVYPPGRIVGWTKIEDLPGTEEHEGLGLQYKYDHKAGTVKLQCKEIEFESDDIVDPDLAESIANSKLGDKLAGWPHWIQSAEYPNCPECRAPMQFVFQVDSEDNVPFMFGDAGCGHITQCAEHKDVVAFGWACG